MTQPKRRYRTRSPHHSANRSTNGLAITSLIFGILSWILLPLLGAVVGIITGHIALDRIKRSEQNGNGMAITGLVLSYLNIGVAGLGIAAAIVLPMYSDYVDKGKVVAAEAMITPTRLEVAKLLRDNVALQDIHIEKQSIEPYWADLRVEAGEIRATYSGSQKVPSVLRGETLIMSTTAHSQGEQWHCRYANTYAKDYKRKIRLLPKICIAEIVK